MPQPLLMTIEIYEPLWIGGRLIETITEPNSISIENQAEGGSSMATITIVKSPLEMELWLDGLGRHIVIKDHTGFIVWAGFVNWVDYKTGFLTISRGPLMDVWNRVKVIYTPYIDISVSPPIIGTETETIFAEDTDSQDERGTREMALAGGTLSDALTVGAIGNEAEELRDIFLEDMKSPSVTQTAIYGRTEEPALIIRAAGYYSSLSSFIIDDTTAGYQTLSDRVTYILNQDPNSILDVDLDIEANTNIITRYARNIIAKEEMNKVVSMGDATNDRWLFSFEEDRRAWFRQTPSQYEYIYYKDGSVRDLSGRLLYPWQIQAGRWMYIADLVSFPEALTRDVVRNHPSYEFIEMTQFQSPFTISIIGSRITRISQFMARKGLSL